MTYRTERRDPAFETEDIPALLVETVLRGAWAVVSLVWAVLLAGSRVPVLSGVSLGAAFVGYFYGWIWVVAAVIVIVAVLVVWRCLRADSYRTVVGPRVRGLWMAPAYRGWFPHVATRCGLYSQDSRSGGGKSDREVARLLKVKVGRLGADRLLVRLPTGFTADDFQSRLPAVTEALRARGASLRVERPGRVWLELRRSDALAGVVEPLDTKATDLAAVPIGIGEDGCPWTVRIRGTHTLIAGATGAGKGSVLWSLVAGMKPGILAGTVEVWAIDPKGGMELGLGQGAFSRFEGGVPEDMCDLLEEAVDLKTRRAMALSTAGVRTHEPLPGSPHLVIIIDELATLTAFAERTVVRRIENALGLLLTQGRAVGISVIAAVQDPGKNVVSWRDLFPTRIAMRLDSAIQVDMVLGEGGRDRGAAADEVSELTPGVAYVRIEGVRDIRRVRASYLTDSDVESLAAEISPVIRPPATHNPQEEEIREEAS